MKHYILGFAFAAFVVVACGSEGDPIIGGGNFACAPGACGGGKCDTTLGCVQCLGDADCRAGEPFCISGRCEACRNNADCGASAPSCWPGDNKCHAKCTDNSQCGSDGTKLCDTALGACVECNTNADCSAPEAICDAFTRRCVRCAANSDCPAAAAHCVRGRCAECTADADCPAAEPRCDLEELECKSAPVCSNTSGCAAPTPICDDGKRCVQCKDDDHCPATTPKCRDNTCTVN